MEKEIIFIRRIADLNTKRPKALYKCHCGLEFITRIYSVTSGHTSSCGCYVRDKSIGNHKKLYHTYLSIKGRCYNPKNKGYINYGGRGIIMCAEWLQDFKVFRDWAYLNDYSASLSIDRKNNDGNYEPSNCQWASRQVQAMNRRKPKGFTNKYLGVFKVGKKYLVRIGFKGKIIRIGKFTTETEAALQYNTAAIHYHGIYAKQNVIDSE